MIKHTLRKLFWPVLKPFENGDKPYSHKPINRIILLVAGCLFMGLSISVLIVAPKDQGLAFLLPVIVFGAVGFVGLVVGFLGSDRAISKIWGGK